MQIEAQMKLLNLRFTTKYFTYGGFIASAFVAFFSVDLAIQFFLIGAAAWALNGYMGPFVNKHAGDAIKLRKEQTAAQAEA